MSEREVWLLDYGAGNVASLVNAVELLGFSVRRVESAADLDGRADRLLFPGVGAFGSCVRSLRESGLLEPLRRYVRAGKPYLGICLGMQVLFDRSDEDAEAAGLGVIPGAVGTFEATPARKVPHMGWSGVAAAQPRSALLPAAAVAGARFYFVHSYRASATDANREWVLARTECEGDAFVSAVQRGNVAGVQFHPEKSGDAGLALLRRFLEAPGGRLELPPEAPAPAAAAADAAAAVPPAPLAKRLVTALDVRSNDAGDLVVTKGDSYDVRERGEGQGNRVRNLGKPVELARKYYEQGADEIVFLNITAFRSAPATDSPMLEVLRETARRVFVPLTVGGGIRGYTDEAGRQWSAVEVAGAYFRSGADKVSIGSDAVHAAERLAALAATPGGGAPDGTSSIEQISRVYGRQAVVVSVDPRRAYVERAEDTRHRTFEAADGTGRRYWYQCTVRGGREGRDVCAIELARASERLGAGEILLNSIDNDGQNAGLDAVLCAAVQEAVSVPVVASSGLGRPAHASELLQRAPGVSAVLGAGIFHRDEFTVRQVKEHMRAAGVPVRLDADPERR